MKITAHQPDPVPVPPTTFTIEGMALFDLEVLTAALGATSLSTDEENAEAAKLPVTAYVTAINEMYNKAASAVRTAKQ